MPTRKYRLALPMNNDNTVVSYERTLPRSSLLLSGSEMSTDSKPGSKTILLNNVHIAAKVPLNPSPRWWLVLPCLLFLMLSSASDPLLMNDLIVRRYERRYGFNASAGAQRTVCQQSITTSAPLMPVPYWQFSSPNQRPPQSRPDYSLVQRDSSSFHIKNSIATLIPAFVTFVLLGSNSDIIGRRPLLVLPFFGKVIRYSTMLVIVSLDLSDTWLIASHALEAIFGSMGLVILSAFAYITDCTNKSRTNAFLITEVITVIARIIPLLAVSLWLRYYLYTVPLCVNLVLSVMGLFYAIFIQPESVESVKNISLIRQLLRVRLKPLKNIITVFIVKRSGKKRQRIILLTIVTILLLFILFGCNSVLALYLYGQPFCFDAFNVGLLSLAQALTVFLTSMFILLCKKTLTDTYFLPLFGSFTLIIGFTLVSVAKRVWLLYVAFSVGSFFFIALPVLRTKLTRLVEVNEYAVVFIAAGILETIANAAVGAVASSIYKASLHFFPGLVFLMFAITGVFPLAIISYLAFSEARESRRMETKTVASVMRTSTKRSSHI